MASHCWPRELGGGTSGSQQPQGSPPASPGGSDAGTALCGFQGQAQPSEPTGDLGSLSDPSLPQGRTLTVSWAICMRQQSSGYRVTGQECLDFAAYIILKRVHIVFLFSSES